MTCFCVYTAWKVSKYWVISGPYFPVFSSNTGKYGPEITPYLNTFAPSQHNLLYFILMKLKIYLFYKCIISPPAYLLHISEDFWFVHTQQKESTL